MFKKNVLISIIILVSNLSIAQRANSNAVSISIYAGDLAILSENFLESYGSKNELAFGGGFGIPISNSFTLNASVTYFSKKSNLAELNEIDQLKKNSLEQIIFNTGLQIHLLPNRIIGLSILCGMTYSLIEEEIKAQSGELIADTKGEGNLGVYGGANFEVSFGRTPLALFGDVKYSYAWDPLLNYEKSYREIRYTGGLKFYLTKRWK